MLCGSGAVSCSSSLLIRRHQRARCQAEIPLTAPSEIVEPPLSTPSHALTTIRRSNSALSTTGLVRQRSIVDARRGHDDIHPDIMRLRVDARERADRMRDTDCERSRIESGKCAVEEPATIAEPITGWVEANQRRNDHGRPNCSSAGWIWNVPCTLLEPGFWVPFPEHERLAFRNNNWKSDANALGRR